MTTKRETQGDKRERELYARAVAWLGEAGVVPRPDSYSVELVGHVFREDPAQVSHDVARFVSNTAALTATRGTA